MKKRYFIGLLIAAVMCINISIPTIAANEEQIIEEPYVYEILPGTEEWVSMSPEERYESCYVSRDIAEKMTTDALVETVLNYPFWINVYTYNTLEEGVDAVASYFPPLSELLSRNDALEVLEDYITDRRVQNRSGEVDLKEYGAESLQIKMMGTAMLAVSSSPTRDIALTPNNKEVEVWRN